MNSTVRSILLVARTTTLVAFVTGGIRAANEFLSVRYVREFQAGPESSLGERGIAIAQAAALEGLGFGAVALVLGLFAAALAAWAPRRSSTSFEQRFSSAWILGAAAFFTWATLGTYVGEAALPFLAPLPLFLFNLAGFTGTLFVFGLLNAVVKRIPGSARPTPAAVALGTVLACALAAHLSLGIIEGESGGYRSPKRLAMAAACFLVALPAGTLIGRGLQPIVRWFEARLAQGRMLPVAVTLGLGALLLVCVATSIPTLQLSATPGKVSYKKLSSSAESGPNVILVTIDTLRADHLGCYGYERPTSPFLDSVANEGALFLDPVSAAAWTKPATGTILTGLYPSRHGALYHGSSLRLPEGKTTLAEAFRNQGFATAGFVTNPNIKKVFDFDRGFDEFFDSPVEDTVTLAAIRSSYFGGILMDLMRHQFNWKYENDVLRMNRHIVPWLRENKDQRFFLYLHYIDPHIPYSPPKAYREDFAQDHGLKLFNERKRLVAQDLYDGEIRYTDDGLRALVDELKALDLWENSLFAVTSDHGEEFFEHGVLGHGFSLYQGVVQVPLIARGPGVKPGTKVQGPVQIVDLGATLLDLAGLGISELGDGTSFAGLARGEARGPLQPYFIENEFGQDHADNRSFVFNGIREGPWKFVLTERNQFFPPERHGREALYNLNRDPEEQYNLFHEEEYRDVIESLLGRLKHHSEFLVETGFRDIKPAALSPEVEQNLRALGY